MSVQIGQYVVKVERESFRIFPKDKYGNVHPILKINQFLTIYREGKLVASFKRYLHRGQWYYRASNEKNVLDEFQVRDELARLLYPVPDLRDGEGRRAGDRQRAEKLMLSWITDQTLAA